MIDQDETPSLGAQSKTPTSDGDVWQSQVESRLGEVERQNKSDIRWRVATISVSVVGALIAAASWCVNYQGQSRAAEREAYSLQTLIRVEDRKVSYVHPGLLREGQTSEKEMLRQEATYARWFEYEGQIENVGAASVQLEGIWIGLQDKESNDLLHLYELERGYLLGAGEQVKRIHFTPVVSSTSDPFPIASFRIYLVIEYAIPGGRTASMKMKLGGYDDKLPVVVRRGTVLPEGTAAHVEFEFLPPPHVATGAARTGQSSVEYSVQRVAP